MFVQVNLPSGGLGPILIEGVKGSALGTRLGQLARFNAYDPLLIALLETSGPENQSAHEIRQRFDDDRLHDDWFDPTPALLALVQQGQETLQQLLAQVQPGAVASTPVDIDTIARMLNVSVRTIRRMIDKNQIPVMRVGRQFRFIPGDVLAALQYTTR